MIVAGQEANKNLKPIIFDPVAIGATSYRRETAKGELGDQDDELRGSACTDRVFLYATCRATGCLAAYGDQGQCRGDRSARRFARGRSLVLVVAFLDTC